MSSFSMAVWTVAVLLAGVGVATVRLINQEQPEPYMVTLVIHFLADIHSSPHVSFFSLKDEIFHVPQAQNYCIGNYSHWDPMITTLPGLLVLFFPSWEKCRTFAEYRYLSSVLWVEPVARILSLPTTDLCTTANLRWENNEH